VGMIVGKGCCFLKGGGGCSRGITHEQKTKLISLDKTSINKVNLPHNFLKHKETKDGLEARQTSKLQNRRPLFDVELYLTVHKFFVSTSLNIIHGGCTFHLSYPYWTITSLYKTTMSSITVTVHKLT
jgi:hypothetical protein